MKKLVPVCEACWIKENSSWEPESVDDGGNIKLRLKGVSSPQYVKTGAVENCEECKSLTIAGIYKVTDPKIVFGEGEEESNEYSEYTGFSIDPEEEEEY